MREKKREGTVGKGSLEKSSLASAWMGGCLGTPFCISVLERLDRDGEMKPDFITEGVQNFLDLIWRVRCSLKTNFVVKHGIIPLIFTKQSSHFTAKYLERSTKGHKWDS